MFPPQSKAVDRLCIDRYKTPPTVGVITAATTGTTGTYFDFLQSKLSDCNLGKILHLDLYANSWRQIADQTDIIYIAGGNTYKLLAIMKQSGFYQYAKKNRLKHSWIGFSAGAVIMGSDIRTSNDQNEIGLSDTTGLGFISEMVAVHYCEEKQDKIQWVAKQLQKHVICLKDEDYFVLQTEQIHQPIK